MTKGLERLGGPPCALVAGSSGKARFSASLTPKAMQFSKIIPEAVGTAPFHKAAIPCEIQERKRLEFEYIL
jgi:hypothetical protein